ncbi:MAG TPA: methyltransferase domain-containing protein [Pseudonocardiaceae bacterium]|nr:methyltransferase domain-containing protein [Pseudonocardiaceae bacterium]
MDAYALDLSDGQRVLEIGTGTGYNAALLCHRLGAANVVSIDIDLTLVDQAREHLAELGYATLLEVGDGADGVPGAAPYDAILATAAVDHIPHAWIEQLRPGGIILTDLRGGFSGAMVRLRKIDGARSRAAATITSQPSCRCAGRRATRCARA